MRDLFSIDEHAVAGDIRQISDFVAILDTSANQSVIPVYRRMGQPDLVILFTPDAYHHRSVCKLETACPIAAIRFNKDERLRIGFARTIVIPARVLYIFGQWSEVPRRSFADGCHPPENHTRKDQNWQGHDNAQSKHQRRRGLQPHTDHFLQTIASFNETRANESYKISY